MSATARLKSLVGTGSVPTLTLASGTTTINLPDETNNVVLNATGSVTIGTINAQTTSGQQINHGRIVTFTIATGSSTITFTNNTGTSTRGQFDLKGANISAVARDVITLRQKANGTWDLVSKSTTTTTDATRTITTLTATTINATSIVRSSQTYQLGRGGTAKAGTTAGWTVNAGNNLGTIATVAQSQTSATLVVAIPNLHVGDTITGFAVYSSINSAGNTVTLDANLRSLTIAAGATGTDASIASITQVSVSTATASSASKTGLSTVVAAGVNYYLLLTCTTGASTTLELSQIEVTVTSA